MSTEPDMLTKLVVTAALILMGALHFKMLISAAKKGLISYYFWGNYDRKTEPAGFWMCVTYNLAGLLFLIWILTVIASDFA
jgi:hypothetical protein